MKKTNLILFAILIILGFGFAFALTVEGYSEFIIQKNSLETLLIYLILAKM
jgi:hypothetical protein